MTKRLLSFAVVMVALPLASPLPAAQTNAPSFPREHARRVIPNVVGVETKEFPQSPDPEGVIAVWDATWESGKRTGMRQRPHDQLAVTLAEGSVRVTRPDSSWTLEHHQLGTVQFLPKGTVTEEEGVSERPRRALVVEFLSYDAVPKIDPKAIAAARAKGMEPQFPRRGATKLFETDRIIVWDDPYPLGQLRELHAHFYTTIGMFIQAGEGDHKPTNTIYTLGLVNFSPPRLRTHRDLAVKGPPRGIFVEYKP